MATYNVNVIIRSDTAAKYWAVNRVLSRGEPAYEWDTKRLKIGDGSTPYRLLPYQSYDPSAIQALTDAAVAASAAAQTARDEAVAAAGGGSPASTTTPGVVLLATSAEALAGTDPGKVITAATLKARLDALPSSGPASTSAAGILRIATAAETAAGTVNNAAVVPSTLAAVLAGFDPGPGTGTVESATETTEGIVRKATDAEALAGTATVPVMTPADTAALVANRIAQITKATIGLGSVQNLAPSAMPVSTAQQNALNLKADATALALKADKANAAFTGTVPTVNGTNVALSTDLSDVVKSKAGRGGWVLIVEGEDEPTGAANEIILKKPGSTTPSTSGSLAPPGLDVLGGVVGCTIADPAIAVIPPSTAVESDSTVFVATAGSRVAARARVYDTRVDRVNWHIGDGSTANVVGTIALVRASNGQVLAVKTDQNLTPSTVTAVTGNTQTWALSTPVTGLTPGEELAVVTQHATGTVRYVAVGVSGLVNITALRTFASGSGDLHRAGALPGAPAMPAVGGTVDLSAAAPNASAVATGWSKRIIPVFVLSKTAA